MSEPIVYMVWTLAELDWLHEAAGISAEWLTSDRRAELIANPEPGDLA